MRYRLKIGERFDLVEILNNWQYSFLKDEAIGKQFISKNTTGIYNGIFDVLFVPFTHTWVYVYPDGKVDPVSFPHTSVKKVGTFIIKTIKNVG